MFDGAGAMFCLLLQPVDAREGFMDPKNASDLLHHCGHQDHVFAFLTESPFPPATRSTPGLRVFSYNPLPKTELWARPWMIYD